jgi:hypothetical protein
MFPVELAVFFQLDLICLLLFVPGGRIVPPLAFRALQNDYISHYDISLKDLRLKGRPIR